MGRPAPEADRDEVRELIYQGYRIIYRTLLHGSRNLAAKEVKPWDVG